MYERCDSQKKCEAHEGTVLRPNVTDGRSDRTRLYASQGIFDLSYLCATNRGRQGAARSTDWAIERSTARYGTLRFAHVPMPRTETDIYPPIHSETRDAKPQDQKKMQSIQVCGANVVTISFIKVV